MSLSYRSAVRATAAAAVMGAGLFALPALADNSWTGSRLVVSGVGGAACRVAITRGYGGTTLSGIRLSIVNRGTTVLDLRGNMRLAGNGSSKTGDMGFVRVPPGTTVEAVTQLTTYGGDMSTTTLTVNVTSCTPPTS